MSTTPFLAPSSEGSPVKEAATRPQKKAAIVTAANRPPTNRTSADYLARRLRLALHDIGLDRHLPEGWVQAGRIGFVFGPMNLRQADHLVLAVEDLYRGLSPAKAAASGRGQLRLF